MIIPVVFRHSEFYSPRPIRFIEVIEHHTWRFKLYGITYGPRLLDRASFVAAMPLALAELPHPAVTDSRPGIGFIIGHQGRGSDYLVLCWWDNENELPTRIYVRPQEQHAPWRPAAGSESICVWDLQVMGFERDAYVRHVLSPADGPNIAAYPNEHCEAG